MQSNRAMRQSRCARRGNGPSAEPAIGRRLVRTYQLICCCTIDRRGLVTYVNPAAEAMLGWRRAELLGKSMHRVMQYKHPDGTRFRKSDCAGYQVLRTGIEGSRARGHVYPEGREFSSRRVQ